MSIKPMLGDWEIPRVVNLQTLEKRSLAALRIPGLPSGSYQKLPAMPTRVFIAGSVFGTEPQTEFLETVREKYTAGEPLTFVADILTGTDVQYVLIEQLKIDVDAQHPDQTSYQMVLTESPPPPPPGGLLDGIDTGLLDQAGNFLDSVTGALDALDALGSIPDLGDPTEPLTGMLDEVEDTMSQLSEATSVITDLFGVS
ncbi:hypothetical protein [Hahella ganghwensis]|uniref:hypothetical protein n=1 Tax=Hahella ganghwensis TaxID=286420 RepID=UPI00036A4756|nr:hypothetical protein [Hahella ganghwensis]